MHHRNQRSGDSGEKGIGFPWIECHELSEMWNKEGFNCALPEFRGLNLYLRETSYKILKPRKRSKGNGNAGFGEQALGNGDSDDGDSSDDEAMGFLVEDSPAGYEVPMQTLVEAGLRTASGLAARASRIPHPATAKGIAAALAVPGLGKWDQPRALAEAAAVLEDEQQLYEAVGPRGWAAPVAI